jgi:hypothetical protein
MIQPKIHAWKVFLVLLLLLAIVSLPSQAAPQQGPVISKGQTDYVPFYSSVFVGANKRLFSLTTTLSVRNTDPKSKLKILAVDIFDSDGQLIKRVLKKARLLNTLGTFSYMVKESVAKDDPGANFIVRWESETAVNAPIIESIMIGTQGQQGISFLARGQVIEERGKK